jgi:hypothetical protein
VGATLHHPAEELERAQTRHHAEHGRQMQEAVKAHRHRDGRQEHSDDDERARLQAHLVLNLRRL